MSKTDPRVDAFIEKKAAPFAQPILKHLRKLVHRACPATEETIKWGMPTFMYDGRILCGMAAFKAHCAFIFWKGTLIVPNAKEEGMGTLGKITSKKDLPSDTVLLKYLRKAMAFNEGAAAAIKRPLKHARKPAPKAPADFMRALKANKRALATYKAFSPSHQREYVQWIVEAKTEETRERRMETAIDWMSEGKHRNWKYERK
ncbi:MAG TPA: YdeI/OmpD-associated family protein [Bdellovibrionota bacterium]|jgi:uncharacterized protein YdeI (YjbR/CyaY-like superfamily)|nr:YdeI/OmpD-associated family protein [Bdellovibrionota bacterium]